MAAGERGKLRRQVLGGGILDLDRRASLAGLLSLAATPALAKAGHAAKAPAPKVPARWAEVDAVARKLVEDRAIPGVSICVARRGTPLFVRGYGWANLETRTPMDRASVCRIGSITKQFTAAAVLLLANEGKLSLDDNL